MLDRKFIVDNIDLVTENCKRRGAAVDLQQFVKLYEAWRAAQTECDELNRKANEVSKSIGQTKDAAERESRKEQGRLLREQSSVAQSKLEQLTADLDAVHKHIPNLTHPDAPLGGEADSVEIRRGSTPIPQFPFKPLDHVVLGERLQLFDFEGGAKVAGHGFYFLKNEAVLLELALQRFAVEMLRGEGFTPIITPDLAREQVLHGTGYMPRGPETQIYSIHESDLCLIATAEITLGGLMAEEILEESKLPLNFVGISHCFRTEAGAHGRATRGLYRVHQFTKVEMFCYTLPEQSDAMHLRLLDLECKLFDALQIPFRVIDTAAGDLGGPAYRKFDLEAWMPGRGEAGEFGEITSTSNCTDFQSRRLGIRYRPAAEKGTRFVHTLNGTAIAISRALIALIENHQQADGSVNIPKVLQPLCGLETITVKN